MNSTREPDDGGARARDRRAARPSGEALGPVPADRGDEPAAVAGRLRLVLAGISRRLRTDWPDHLTPSRVSALATIATAGPLPVGELARRMAVSAPTVSHIVDALEKLGLVDRRPDPHDRRVCRLALSPAGDELLDDLGRRATGFLADRIRFLPDDQRIALAAALPALEALAAAPEQPNHEGTQR